MPDPKQSVQEFAAKIKAKYPAYKDMDDYELSQKIVSKYPTYAEQVDLKKKEQTEALASQSISEDTLSSLGSRQTENKIGTKQPLPDNQRLVGDLTEDTKLKQEGVGLKAAIPERVRKEREKQQAEFNKFIYKESLSPELRERAEQNITITPEELQQNLEQEQTKIDFRNNAILEAQKNLDIVNNSTRDRSKVLNNYDEYIQDLDDKAKVYIGEIASLEKSNIEALKRQQKILESQLSSITNEQEFNTKIQQIDQLQETIDQLTPDSPSSYLQGLQRNVGLGFTKILDTLDGAAMMFGDALYEGGKLAGLGYKSKVEEKEKPKWWTDIKRDTPEYKKFLNLKHSSDKTLFGDLSDYYKGRAEQYLDNPDTYLGRATSSAEQIMTEFGIGMSGTKALIGMENMPVLFAYMGGSKGANAYKDAKLEGKSFVESLGAYEEGTLEGFLEAGKLSIMGYGSGKIGGALTNKTGSELWGEAVSHTSLASMFGGSVAAEQILRYGEIVDDKAVWDNVALGGYMGGKDVFTKGIEGKFSNKYKPKEDVIDVENLTESERKLIKFNNMSKEEQAAERLKLMVDKEEQMFTTWNIAPKSPKFMDMVETSTATPVEIRESAQEMREKSTEVEDKAAQNGLILSANVLDKVADYKIMDEQILKNPTEFIETINSSNVPNEVKELIVDNINKRVAQDVEKRAGETGVELEGLNEKKTTLEENKHINPSIKKIEMDKINEELKVKEEELKNKLYPKDKVDETNATNEEKLVNISEKTPQAVGENQKSKRNQVEEGLLDIDLKKMVDKYGEDIPVKKTVVEDMGVSREDAGRLIRKLREHVEENEIVQQPVAETTTTEQKVTDKSSETTQKETNIKSEVVSETTQQEAKPKMGEEVRPPKEVKPKEFIEDKTTGETKEITKPSETISETKTKQDAKETKTKEAEVLKEKPVESKVEPEAVSFKEEIEKEKDTVKAAELFRSFKMTKPGELKTGITTVVWDGSMEAIATAIEGGAKVVDAINKGLEHIKGSDWYKGLSSEKQKEIDKGYVDHINDQFAQPKQKAKTKKQKEVEKEAGKRETKKVLVNEYTALKDQIKTQAKIAKDIHKLNKESMESINDFIKDNSKELKQVSEAGLLSITRDIAKITNLEGQAKANHIEKTLDKLDKLTSDAAFQKELKDKSAIADKILKETDIVKKTPSGKEQAKGSVKVESDVDIAENEYFRKVNEVVKKTNKELGFDYREETAKLQEVGEKRIVELTEGKELEGLKEEDLNNNGLTDSEQRELEALEYGSIYENTLERNKEILADIKERKSNQRDRAKEFRERRKAEYVEKTNIFKRLFVPKGRKIPNKIRPKKGRFAVLDSSFKSLLDKLNINPDNRSGDIFKDEVHKEAYKPLRESENKWKEDEGKYQKELEQKVKEIFEVSELRRLTPGGRKGVIDRKLLNFSNKEDVAIEIINEEGKKEDLKLTQFEAADAYLLLKDVETHKDFFTEKMKGRKGGNGWTEESVKQLDKQLLPEVKEIADYMFDMVNKSGKEGLYDYQNETYKKEAGINLRKRPNYWMKDAFSKSIGEAIEVGEQKHTATAVTSNRHIDRVKAPVEIDFTNVMDKYLKYVRETTQYKNFAKPVRVLSRSLLSPEVRDIIDHFHGKNFNKALRNQIEKAAGVAGKNDKILTKSLEMVTKGILGFTRSVPIKQLISSVMYATEVPTHAIPIYSAKMIGNAKGVTKFLNKHALLKFRNKEAFDLDKQALKGSLETGGKAGFYRKKMATYLPNQTYETLAFGALKTFDKLPIRTAGGAYFLYRMKKAGYTWKSANKEAEKMAKKEGMTKDEALAKILEKPLTEWDNISESTQQSNSMFNTSYIRDKMPGMRLLTTFTSGPSQIHRIAMSGIRDMKLATTDVAKNGLTKRNAKLAYKGTKKFIISHVMMGTIYQIVGNGLNFDEKKFLKGMILGNVNGLAGIGKLITGIADSFTGDTFQNSDTSPFFSTVYKMAADFGRGNNWQKKGDPVKANKYYVKGIHGLLTLGGVSVRNVDKIIKDINIIAKQETDKPIEQALGLESEYHTGKPIPEKIKEVKEKVQGTYKETEKEREERLKKEKNTPSTVKEILDVFLADPEELKKLEKKSNKKKVQTKPKSKSQFSKKNNKSQFR